MAWRQLWRDWRAGELRLLVLAVLLAVAALCAVSFLSDRLDQGLRRDAAQLLGGDAVVASDQPTPVPLTSLAGDMGLRVLHTVSFPSMARSALGATRLVSVKAVSENYPLRGSLELVDGRRVGAPPRSQVWVDAGVLDALALKLGDELLLGELSLHIAGVIRSEPDRGAGFLSFAPRLMLAQADLAATGLVQPTSRVTYRFALAAADESMRALQRYTEIATALIEREHWRGVRIESLESGRPEMRQTLDRASKFLKLVAMLSALLAAVAVALAARDFANRHLDDCAMLRVLGQPQRRIALAYALEFGGVGLLASLAGVLLGYGLHYVFVALLAGLMTVSLPAASLWPALLGLALGLSLLVGFGLPPILQLAAVPALRVIRRDVGNLKAGSLLVMGTGVLGFAAILVALSADLKLGLIAAGGFAVALAVFALLAWLSVKLLRRLVPDAGAPRWLLLATRQVAARPVFAVLQVSSLAVGLLALALLVLLRTDLISSWRQSTPTDAPDRFVINIQPDQGPAVRESLEQAGVKRFDWFPMIRGRLVAINGAEVLPGRYADDRAQRLVEREFNLSHARDLPAHNVLTQGAWHPDNKDELSVEEGLAKTLGLKLGDRLRFDVAGVLVEAHIGNLRRVDWTSMRVNFFVMFPRSEMPELPSSLIAAYKAPPGGALDRTLSHDFPNLTSIDVSAQIAQVQAVLDQVITAVQYLFLFTLATGLIVLLAAVSSTREARTREFALMRALGASSRLLAQVQRAELLGVGALAGALAGLMALAISGLLAHQVFDFEWQPNLLVPLLCTVCGALLAQLAGWWSLRGVLTRPVVQTLREAAQ